MNEHGYPDEMPLPTYEEVVGASNHNIGFKDDVLLRTRPANAACQADSELVGECVGVPSGENRSGTLRRLVRCKQWTKKYLAALVGVIITPIFFLFVILQLKSCGTCKSLQEENQEFMVKLDDCKAKMMDTSERYNKVYSDLQFVKKKRNELLLNKEIADAEMKKLYDQYQTATSYINDLRDQQTVLKKEIDKYKILLKELSNENKASSRATSETNSKKTTKGFPNFLNFGSVKETLEFLKIMSTSNNSFSELEKALQIFTDT